MATATKSTLSNQIKTYYIMKLLMRALPRLVHNRWGMKATIPKRAGGTAEWRKFGSLTAVSSALGEADWGYGGTIPAPVDPTQTNITASPSYYGAYIEYTDDLEREAIDPVVEQFSEVLGEQAGLSIDRLTRTELRTNLTTIVRPGTLAADNTITANDVMDFPLWAKAFGTLLAGNTLPVNGDRYAAIVHPHTLVDMLQDTTIHKSFQNRAFADNEDPFKTGFFGTLLNVDVYVTTEAYVATNAGSGGTVDVYYTIFLGKEAYGTLGISGKEMRDVDMAGMEKMNGMTGQQVKPIDLIVKELGYKDAFDSIGTIAWKAAHVAKVLNVAFAVVARHASSLGTN